MLKFIRHLFRRRQPERVILPAPLHIDLTPRERMELRDWLDNPVTQKALGIVAARHPGLRTHRIAKNARSEWDERAAVNYLNRIAGWEAYRDTLLTIAEPPTTLTEVPETYPTV